MNLIFSNLLFIICLFMIMNIPSFELNFINLGEFLGVDSISWMLCLLTFWVFSLVFLMINNNILLNLLLIVLLMFLYLCFSSLNMFMFYFFFESSMIPIFLIIIFYGISSTRYLSSMYMFFFTLLFSLPFLVLLIEIYNFFYSFSIYLMSSFYFMSYSTIEMMLMVMVFLIKIPVFMFHVWLPKAHVDAPVYGSMILAAIMLKLGGYGLIRVMKILKSEMLKINMFILEFSYIGSIISSMISIRQIDMKILVAYSSVVHMNFMLSGLMSMKLYGVIGTMVMMISHGLSSSGLFYLVNFNYLRSGSRLLIFNKGFMLNSYYMMYMWFFCIFSNMAVPMFLNLIGELMILSSLISLNYIYMIYFFFLGMFSSFYSLYLLVMSFHGKMVNKFYSNSGKIIDFYIMMMHILPLILFMLMIHIFNL